MEKCVTSASQYSFTTESCRTITQLFKSWSRNIISLKLHFLNYLYVNLHLHTTEQYLILDLASYPYRLKLTCVINRLYWRRCSNVGVSVGADLSRASKREFKMQVVKTWRASWTMPMKSKYFREIANTSFYQSCNRIHHAPTLSSAKNLNNLCVN